MSLSAPAIATVENISPAYLFLFSGLVYNEGNHPGGHPYALL